MKKKYLISLIISIVIHILVIFLFSALKITFKKLPEPEIYREVSFVYEKDLTKSLVEKKSVLSQKQKTKKKKVSTIKQGKEDPVSIEKKKAETTPEKVELPEVKDNKTDQQENLTKKDAKEVKPEDSVEPVTNQPLDKDNQGKKEIIGGVSGNNEVDLRPSKNVEIYGPIVNRNILYSEVPKYPDWARRRGIEAEVRMMFWVTPEGDVYNITVQQKSGHLRLDLLASRAMKKWKFSPLDKDLPQVKQWGEIVVRFILY